MEAPDQSDPGLRATAAARNGARRLDDPDAPVTPRVELQHTAAELGRSDDPDAAEMPLAELQHTAAELGRSDDPDAAEMPLAELQHTAVELGRRHVERLGRQRLAVELDAALGQHPPCVRARATEDVGDHRR